jgi:hypothetical protein
LHRVENESYEGQGEDWVFDEALLPLFSESIADVPEHLDVLLKTAFLCVRFLLPIDFKGMRLSRCNLHFKGLEGFMGFGVAIEVIRLAIACQNMGVVSCKDNQVQVELHPR